MTEVATIGRIRLDIERDGKETVSLGFVLTERMSSEDLRRLFKGLADSGYRVVSL